MKRLLIIALISGLLAACATTPMSTKANNKTLNWPERKAELNNIHAWKISGGLALKTQQKALSASVNWQQFSRSRYKLTLFGPLGAGTTVITGKPGQVVLRQVNQKPLVASSANQLLQTHLGWHLPINNLYYWVRGLPAPGGHASITFDAYHHIKRLQQQGWTVRYLRYAGVKQYDLPSLIQLNGQGLSIKMVIGRWQL